jgi:plasmid stabilization system protein ParE
VKRRPVRLTQGAEQDLAGIYRRRVLQRGEDGDDGADALLDALVETIEGLATFSGRGPVPPELEALGIDAYRQLSLPPFRIIYLPSNEAVTVMIVADSRRDFRLLLEERLLLARR